MNPSRQEEVLRLARSFMESRILLTGAELNLFTLLSESRLTAAEIAARAGADVRALTVLLDALAAMGLLEKQGRTYRCESETCRHLSEDAPDSVLAMVLHAAHLWHRWSGLTQIVRGEGLREGSRGPAWNAKEMKAFIGAMHAVAAPMADRIIAAVQPGDAGMLIDVGGASGTYTIAFLRAVPGMKATLFDRPGVIEMARERLRGTGPFSPSTC